MQTAVCVFLLLSFAAVAFGFPQSEVEEDQEAVEISERLLRPVQSGIWWRGGFPRRPTKLTPNRSPSKRWRISFKPKICVIAICLKRRQLSDATDDTATEQLESTIELYASKSVVDFRSLYSEKVVKAALYRIPSSAQGSDVADEGEINGVLITLPNDRQLMITYGQEVWGDKQSAILEAEDLTDKWEFVESKNVQFSVVADYVNASDSSSTSTEAAKKMMALD